MQIQTVTETKDVRPVTKTLQVSQAESVVNTARKYYGDMQRSWFMFGKTVNYIKQNNIWEILGYKSFREFSLKEYPGIQEENITKMTRIVEKIGLDIEGRLERNPEYLVPPSETCYQLTTAQSKIPEEDYFKLREKVLDSKVSVLTLRDELKKIIDSFKKKIVKKTIEETEEELLEDIQGESYSSDDIPDVEVTSSVKRTIGHLAVKTAFLSENLPFLRMELQKDPSLYTDDVTDLADGLNALQTKIEDFLTTVDGLN